MTKKHRKSSAKSRTGPETFYAEADEEQDHETQPDDEDSSASKNVSKRRTSPDREVAEKSEFNEFAIQELEAERLLHDISTEESDVKSIKKKKKKRSADLEVAENEVNNEESSLKSILKNRKTDEDLDYSEVLTNDSSEKKSRKKRKENPSETEVLEDKVEQVSEAIKYLRRWKIDRSSWRFNKHSQILLLRSWNKCLEMDKKDFKLFLEYISPMKGGSRLKTMQDAEKLLEENEMAESFGDDAEAKKIICKRARKIIKALQSDEKDIVE